MSIAERRPQLLHADQGKVVRARGDLYLFKALAAQTAGHYSLFEVRSPTGGGVPLHRHHRDEEGVVVLEGRYRFHERYFEEGWEVIEDLHSPPPPRELDFARLRAAMQSAGLELVAPAPGPCAAGPGAGSRRLRRCGEESRHDDGTLYRQHAAIRDLCRCAPHSLGNGSRPFLGRS